MFLQDPPKSVAAEALIEEARAEEGYVPTFLRAWCWRPEVHRSFRDLRTDLAESSTLSDREVALLNATTASRLGDASCSLAWGTKLAKLANPMTAVAVLTRNEAEGLSERERALESWATAVVTNPNGTTQQQVEELKRAGLTEQEIFDATVLVASRLAFATVNDALGVAPDRQLADGAPADVRESVTWGRAIGDRARA